MGAAGGFRELDRSGGGSGLPDRERREASATWACASPLPSTGSPSGGVASPGGAPAGFLRSSAKRADEGVKMVGQGALDRAAEGERQGSAP